MSKRIKDRNAPKKPSSNFILFGKSIRDENPEIRKLPVSEQSILIAKKWSEVDEDVKNKFKLESKKLKKEYEEKLKEYKETDLYKQHLYMVTLQENKENKKKKRKNPTKMSGYRLFVRDYKETEEDKENPELQGKGHVSLCAYKWSKLSDDVKKEYNERAAAMEPIIKPKTKEEEILESLEEEKERETENISSSQKNEEKDGE